MQTVASFPSPSQGVWHLGPVPIRAYALMIIIGIVVAVWLGERRWAAKGGTPGVIIDVAVWAVPFGLVGGRLYHVVTDYQNYFGDGKDPINALKIWEGGLGIWGAVLLGGVGAWIGCRRHGVSVLALGDAIAPGIALAQAIGRWGNYWNQELYGRPLDAAWALEIDQSHRPRLSDGTLDPKYADVATYHPTFLYESLWCVGVAVVVIWAGRRYNLTHGRTFALYVAAYTVGRFWIEYLRIDTAHEFLGLRLNDWTSIVVFIGAVAYIYVARGRTGPEAVGVPQTEPADGETAEPEPGPERDEAEPVALTKTDEPTKTAAEAEPEEAPEPEAEATEPEVTEPEADAAPEPEAVPATEAEPETEVAADTEADAAPEPEAVPATEPEAEVAAVTEPEADVAPEPELADDSETAPAAEGTGPEPDEPAEPETAVREPEAAPEPEPEVGGEDNGKADTASDDDATSAEPVKDSK
ncbi:prolipoprotein diacylglyceryl transferase [Spirillospora sp. CA-294931]|uniref:prolipoprotein diacylglyceryl transferase n=1 Tax=Spirillospora sp. CA-294931 TaxID=3240042 RepID=UPI003D8A8A9A